MKNVLLLFAILFSLGTAYGQLDLFSASVTKSGDKYVVKDTSGTTTNMVITQMEMDSAEFVRQMLDRVYEGLRIAAYSKVESERMSREAGKYQALLQKQGLLQAYLDYARASVSLKGGFAIKYGDTSIILYTGPEWGLYTNGGARVVDILPIVDNHLRLTLRTLGNEKVDIYRAGAKLWWGRGQSGDFIMTQIE